MVSREQNSAGRAAGFQAERGGPCQHLQQTIRRDKDGLKGAVETAAELEYQELQTSCGRDHHEAG